MAPRISVARVTLSMSMLSVLVILVILAAPSPMTTMVSRGVVGPETTVHAQGQPPADIRAIIEGTWTLVEWHVGGQVLRPPLIEGRWMVHDGLVMAIRHRDGPDGFESTAGYGEYRWGSGTWTYGYERSEDLTGPSSSEVELTVSGERPIRMRTFDITRVAGHLRLTQVGGGLVWDYDIAGRTFVLMTDDGRPIRTYRRVES